MVTTLHIPVMLNETLFLIGPGLARPGALMVDATLGLGGHAEAALTHYPELHVIGIDRDPEAIAAASERLRPFGDRFEARLGTYNQMPYFLDGRRPTAILFDLGLSSLQIDSLERGFAYSYDAELSMRMDGHGDGLTAADVVNTYTARDLARLFREYGDERFAARIAAAIVAERTNQPFTTSARLVEVITAAVPAGSGRSGHPAKRVFQALRIEVNDERTLLVDALPAALSALAVTGRMAVLSYHSGEDRIVKSVFAAAGTDKAPPGLPVVPEQYQARFRLLTRGACRPSDEEMADNPRSQSARLRVIERIKEDL